MLVASFKVKFSSLVMVLTFGAVVATFEDFEVKSIEKRTERALDKTLDYILDNYKRINVDGLFGVVFAKAHIDTILRTFDKDDHLTLEKLKTKADLIYSLVKPRLYKGETKQIIFLEEIIDPILWQREIAFRHGSLTSKPPFLRQIATDGATFDKVDNFDSLDKIDSGDAINSFNNLDKFLKYLKTTNMSEAQSDECILELIATGSKNNKHDCQLSDFCQRYMIEDPFYDPTYGITHRLLYLQIARSRKCMIDKEWYTAQTQDYCSYILWEAMKNAQFGFLDELDDVLLEQITLCGYEGYAEFFHLDFVEHVLEAQTVHGCFSLPSPIPHRLGNHRNRRSATMISFGCNDHTTGLGASTLALILRYLKLGDSRH